MVCKVLLLEREELAATAMARDEDARRHHELVQMKLDKICHSQVS